MKVLQVVVDLDTHATGVLVSVQQFCRALNDLGHEVTLVSFDRRDYSHVQWRKDISANVVSVPGLRIPGLKRYTASPGAAFGNYDHLTESSEAVFIHAMYGHHFTWAARRAERRQIPAFVVPHGSLTNDCLSRRTRIKKCWLARVEQFIGRYATIVFSSSYERKQALQYVRALRTEVIYWPALSFPAAREPNSEDPTEPPKLLLPGRLHPVKRTLETVRSFGRIQNPGWQLCLAGLPSPQISVTDVRRAAGSEWDRSIRYLGNLSERELETWYARAKGVVLFSKGENFSHAAARGLIAQVPVYVSQDVGIGELINKYGGGRVFTITSDMDIDRALTSITSQSSEVSVDNPVLREELSFEKFRGRLKQLIG
jgi:glycosyltransferase involved in cell wall biosynthesis